MSARNTLILLAVIVCSCFYPPKQNVAQARSPEQQPPAKDSLMEVFDQEIRSFNSSIKNVEQEQTIIQIQNQLNEATYRTH